MRVFVINLDKSVERMRSADRQLGELGIEYERFPAVDGTKITGLERRRVVGFRWWCATGNKIRDAELGCALSHIGIYKKMIVEDIPVACILEDDVKLAACLPDVLRYVEQHLSADMLEVDLLSNRTVYESSHLEIRSSVQDSSAEAYIITRAAAKRILKVNLPLAVACDNWQRFARLGSVQICNIYPTSCLKNDFWFGSMTSEGWSPVAAWPFARRIIHKAKRCIGKSIDELLMFLGV